MVPQVLSLLKYVRLSSKVTSPMPETAQERSGFSEFQMERIIRERAQEQKENDAELSGQSSLRIRQHGILKENVRTFIMTLGKHLGLSGKTTLRLNQD